MSRWFMPDESAPHQCTWIAFGPDEKVWGDSLIDEVRRNLASIAQTVARFEPVVLCLREEEIALSTEYFESLDNIYMFPCPLNDIWIRDFGPVFVLNQSGKKAIVDFNFNGWGEKQDFESDAAVAAKAA
ncbi:MAG: agmatine deiminase family protein, partial [Planctomycetota bacterium]